MQTPHRLHLVNGVSVEAIERHDGWHAARFTVACFVRGTLQRVFLDAPPEIAARAFSSPEELAPSALRWLEKRDSS